MLSKHKITLKQRIVSKLENNYLFVIGWLIVGTVAIGITLSTPVSWLAIKYKETLGNIPMQYKKLESLSANVHISNFVNALGNPAIVNSIEKESLKDYVFVNKYYYVDVLTNEDGKVLSFAVTARDKQFKPAFELPPISENGKPLKITLNVSTLGDISPLIEEGYGGSTHPTCTTMFGVRRFWYFEGLYDGNPDNYQSVYYGINDAGYLDMDLISDLANKIGSMSSDCRAVPNEFRNGVRVNTFMITAPFEFMALESSKAAQIKFGVDSDEVRVIK